MKRIIIFGASSAIAASCARLWAANGASFSLVGRDPAKLEHVAQDLKARGAGSADVVVADLDDISRHEEVVDASLTHLGGSADVVLVAHGTLPKQEQAEQSVDYALQQLATNGSNVIALLLRLAPVFERQKGGTLAVITSVAGDRGRRSNHLYGAAKASVATFCDGLRGRLRPAGARVVVIKPGFVRTPMTEGMKLPGPLVASPERVAENIVSAVADGKANVYTPGFWRLIMFIIRHLPASAVARMRA